MSSEPADEPTVDVRRVKRNALATAVQVILTGLGYVLLYHFLLQSLGDRAFGIWALLLSLSSVSNIANLGLAGACVPFVANDISRGNAHAAASVVSTATLTVAGLLLLALLGTYPIVERFLPLIAGDPDLVGPGLTILPLVLLSLWFAAIASVFLASIDGCHRMDIRSALVVVSMVVYLVGSYVLVPELGLMGVAIAHACHTAVLMVLSWFMLRRELRTLPLWPYRWDRRAFARIYRYGAAMQLITITQLLVEPITKSLISIFGGLSLVSMYEFASRMAIQLRGLISSSHRAILPAIAAIDQSSALVRRVFARSYRLIQSLVVFSLPALILGLPVIADVWIGRQDSFFLFAGATLLTGWFLSLLAGPAYYGFLGAGRARWPAAGHMLSGATNLALGTALGLSVGPHGVVAASAVAVLVGSALTDFMYRREHNVPLRESWMGRPFNLLIQAVFALIVAFVLSRLLPSSMGPSLRYGMATLLFAFLMSVPVHGHSGISDIISQIRHTRGGI